MFRVRVDSRYKRNLTRIIETKILPGKHIITEGWQIYMNLGRYEDYTHSYVLHQYNFILTVILQFMLKMVNLCCTTLR